MKFVHGARVTSDECDSAVSDVNGGGALFANKRKCPGSSEHDYFGELVLGGVAYPVRAWLALDRHGSRYLRIKTHGDAERN